MMSKYIIADNELYHAGVKGMKWGVRRYQNPDGTLTEAGKKRYAKAIQRTYKGTETVKASSDLAKDTYIQKYVDDVRSAHKEWSDATDAWEKEYRRLETDKKYTEAAYKDAEKYAKPGTRGFEKTYEYSLDALISEDPALVKLSSASDKAYNAYRDKRKQLANDIVGKYGKMPAKTVSYHWQRDDGLRVSNLIETALFSAALNKEFER